VRSAEIRCALARHEAGGDEATAVSYPPPLQGSGGAGLVAPSRPLLRVRRAFSVITFHEMTVETSAHSDGAAANARTVEARGR
jgi:hypothetical protein